MAEVKKIIKKQVLPLLPLRDLTLFPYMVMHFDVGRKKSIKALEEAMINNQLIFFSAQKDSQLDDPEWDDIYSVGTISKIKQLLKLPGDTVRVLVEGISRAKITKVTQTEPFIMCEVAEYSVVEQNYNNLEMEAIMRTLHTLFEEYITLSNKLSPDAVVSIMTIEEPGRLADAIASNMSFKQEDKQYLLDEFDNIERLEKLIVILTKEIEILKVEISIGKRVKIQIDKNQKEYFLREQLKAIKKELGDKDGIAAEVAEYKEKIIEADLPETVEEKAFKEVDRLLKMPSGSAEGSVVRNYLDWILDLPWDKYTDENFDLTHAEEILNDDHYGLEKVKERILEYLAVRHMAADMKGPILCLVGPPGVGKTSIAKSVARSLNRNYVRMSLGGVRDEAEIRGHRRTYVGSMPGRIISALKQAQSNNPLILLDEIDKMSNDFRGDPTSAMLEVLDSEQNHSFRDHYLELPVDLSQVLFLTTANSLDTIARPLLDRMEVIRISGYTEDEKVNIAKKYLLPKQLKQHGLKKKNLKISDKVIKDIVNYYTRESGVRTLERQLADISRKTVKIMISNNQKSVTINSKNIEKYLGNKKYRYDTIKEKDEIGVATGLAWTSVGGDTLSIEVNVMEGSGKIELTGQLGDVMKESAKAAISYIRSKASQLKINKNFHKDLDIHIHVPEGATPKDGPSAGITMATALISALTNIPVKRNMAMTGEITLRGRVLPIGGLKEKALAAHRSKIYNIIIPAENEADIDEIPDNIRSEIKFILADNMDIVIETALNTKGCGKVLYELQNESENIINSPLIEHIPSEIKNELPVMEQ